MDKLKKILAVLSVTAALTCLSVMTVSADETDTEPEQPAVTEVTDTDDPAASVTDADTPAVTEQDGEHSDADVITSETVQTSVTTVTTPVRTEVTRMENDSAPQGWNNFDGRWYYKNGKKFLTGIKEIDGEYYSFAPSGALKTGWQTVKGLRKYFDSESHSPIYGWIEFLGSKYYTDKENGKISGKYTIGGKDYIFSESGILQTGFVSYEDAFYYCGEDGVIVLPESENIPVMIDETPYYLKADGIIKTGWQTTDGLRRFFDPETGRVVYGWISNMGHIYYADKESGKYTGVKYIEGHPYRFGENGILRTGIQAFETDGETVFFYCCKDGSLVFNTFVKEGSDYYFVDENGQAATGWYTDENGDTYYFDPETCKAKTGFNNIDGERYYFSDKGVMTKGFLKNDGHKYFFDENGRMVYGYYTCDGDTYYFDDISGVAAKGWATLYGEKHYFNKDCVMAQEFYTIDEYTYYFGPDGAMRTGWQTIKDDKYFFDDNGRMYTYRHVMDGKDVLFGKSGKLITTGNQKMPLKALTQLGQDGGKPFWGDYWGSPWRFEWCACFVSWCAAQCGYAKNDVMPEFISCKVGIEWFKKHKVWKGRDYTPVSGDIVFFDWEPDGVADHVGIVDYCEDGMLYTIEGNSNDMVRQKSYKLDSKKIFGFASPKY